jgi:hypothetical protein
MPPMMAPIPTIEHTTPAAIPAALVPVAAGLESFVCVTTTVWPGAVLDGALDDPAVVEALAGSRFWASTLRPLLNTLKYCPS